ncbi:MAG TPA: ATP-binding protein, partial [Pyrinomonadaceae bacterium]|nr:ATP-binding protein [Pyrinomonadaceae bacterium]
MGERMRSFDWSRTPLGPAESWPQSLKTAVRIMLTSRQPIWLGWGDELIKLYNDPYKTIVGGKHPDALGQPASVVWREIWDDIGPMLRTAMGGVEGTYVEEQLLIMERNGYPEETYYTFSYSPIPNDDGSVGGIICANTDDTCRVIGERQLALLRELAAKTADARTLEEAFSLSTGCLAANPHDLPFALLYLVESEARRVVLAGRSSGVERGHSFAPEEASIDAETTWPFAEVLSTNRTRLVRDLSAFGDALPKGAWDRPPHRAAVVPIAAQGRAGEAGILVVGLNPYRLFDEDYRGFLELVAAQIAASIANARAYDEERRRAEALAELDRAKTAFFSNVSHEFRTPLALMLGPLEDLLQQPRGALGPEQHGQLEVVHRNAMRLLRQVNTLLDFSRIEAGRVQATFEPTDLATLTADFASVFRSAVERAGLRLSIDCEPLPAPVFVDREMWEKVVLNLVSNAFKFTFEGGIEVSLRAADGAAQLTVRDTGIGIPAKEIPHLFERFHRVEGARGRTYEGTGIGLALVQELVRLHGGSVRVESEPGEGSAFIVTLPFGQSHLPAERTQPARTLASTALAADAFVEEALRWLPNESPDSSTPSAVPVGQAFEFRRERQENGAKRPRILLADDNADMRDYVRRLLSARYEVEAVADGEAALASAQTRPPDLVLTDIMMPRLDGFGLLKALREDPSTGVVPVILLSARAGEESRVEGIEAGADDYLVKPFAARELLARVRTNLELARIRREAQQQIIDIWESITDALIALDRDWRYVYINAAAEQTGLNRAELLGKSIWEAFPDIVGTDIEDNYRRAASERAPVEFVSFYEPWGKWFENRIFPAPDGGLAAYFRDITERKRAEEERERLLAREQEARAAAESASRMKDEFLATVSHELRTPLNSILGWANMLRRGMVDEGMISHGLDVIERNARAQNQLVEDLLDVSRIITGKLRLEVQPVELVDVIGAAADVVRPAAEAKEIRLELLLDPNAGPVAGDPQRLQQVVWNLLSNAVKFTPRGGRVQARLERVKSHVEIIVSDTGEGIGPDFLPHVFERFRQADGSYTRRHGGMGLGLAIVRHLVELHGGTVEAESGGAGQGSTFTVKLPLIIAKDAGRFREAERGREEAATPQFPSVNTPP